MPTFGSFFSGGGLADVGAKMAGYTLTFANEIDPAIAEVYRRNLGDHIIIGNVLNLDIDALPVVDLFHASPVCTNASIANNNRGEKELDILTAQKTAEYIRKKLPKAATIENVTQYKQFAAYRLIIATLDECGYWHNADTLNSADFGVPQTRRRLVVRAVRGGWVPALPAPVRWIGWYEAIEDLIDTLPDDKFSDWQIKRLSAEYKNCLFSNQSNFTTDSIQYSQKNDPCFSIVATIKSNSSYRAFIVPGGNASSFSMRDASEPTRTIGDINRVGNISKAFIMSDFDGRTRTSAPAFTVRAGENGGTSNRAWLSSGRVARMTPRALARFQSVPDWYELPENKKLAGKIIGNGVPCLMYKAVAESLK